MFAMMSSSSKSAPEVDLVDVPRARDKADRMTEGRLVQHQRRDRRDERDEVEHAEDARSLLVRTHVTPFPSPLHRGDGRGIRNAVNG